MLVAPITAAVDGDTNTSSRSIWLPKGEWVAWESPSQGTSALLQGPTVVTREFGLSEVPVFVRAGACIPTRTMVSAYNVRPPRLVHTPAPTLHELTGGSTTHTGHTSMKTHFHL